MHLEKITLTVWHVVNTFWTSMRIRAKHKATGCAHATSTKIVLSMRHVFYHSNYSLRSIPALCLHTCTFACSVRWSRHVRSTPRRTPRRVPARPRVCARGARRGCGRNAPGERRPAELAGGGPPRPWRPPRTRSAGPAPRPGRPGRVRSAGTCTQACDRGLSLILVSWASRLKKLKSKKAP